MDGLKPEQPNLTRLDKRLGEFENDIRVVDALKPFKNQIYNAAKSYGHDSNDVINKIFNGRYTLEDIDYRSGILEQLLENPKILRLWNTSIGKLHLYNLRELRNFEWNSYDYPCDEDTARVNRALRTMKWINLPDTIDALATLPEKSRGFCEVNDFFRKNRDLLEEFYTLTEQYVKKPFIIKDGDELKVDIDWHDSFVDKIFASENGLKGVTSIVTNLADFRHQMSYYKAMTIPYVAKCTDGTKVISSKPLFVDKDLREAKFVEAYHPTYFKMKTHYQANTELLSFNVPNDFEFNDKSRTTFVLGPNGRGKSVYIRTVGLNMQLAMNGSYVFAKEARLSPIDDIFTSFDMGDSLGAGHFHTGAKKLINMRDNVTPYSVVLVDETGGGTEPEAESWIAAGVAKALNNNNITAMYVTHEKGIWKKYVGQDNVQFIRTSDLDDDERLFRIFPGIIESGYGKKIVKNLGLDPKTMNDTIKGRFNKNYSHNV